MFHALLLLLVCCQIGIIIANPSVIIVGAGASGIAAATKLLENSITNITILEAEDRIGGRIRSVKFGDAFVDLGAEYCHGEKGNIAYELTKDFNILKPGSLPVMMNLYYSNGSQLDSALTDEFNAFFESEFTETRTYNVTGKTLGDVFIHEYNTKFLNKFENDSEKLKILKDGLRFIEGGVLSLEAASSWFDVAAESDDEMCEGDQSLNWSGYGYKTILEILMKSYPDPSKKLPIDDKIHLNKKVIEINWNDDKLIRVRTTDGDTYNANYVIFTPSVGVLKNQQHSLFNPHLPSIKQEAIEAIGFGAVIKILFHFPTKWWNDEDKTFFFYWSEEDIRSIDFSEGPTKNGVSWIVDFLGFLQAPNNSNVFIGWVTGALVPEIEAMPLETLKNGCFYAMNKFFGKDYNITEIGEIRRSTWYSDENFKGSYSFTKAGTYQKNVSYQANLAEPINGVGGHSALLFAGEGTNRLHFGTVHGAIETGHREAERIINLTKNN